MSDEADRGDESVLVSVPPLVVLLTALEDRKGSPLTEAEVIAARNKAVCMSVSQSVATNLERQRGYPDLDPEQAWEQWHTCVSEEEDAGLRGGAPLNFRRDSARRHLPPAERYGLR